MKFKFDIRELEPKSSKRVNLPLECYHCKNTFYIKRASIRYELKRREKKSLKYCSRECFDQSKITRKELQCEFCSKNFTKLICQILKTRHHFCSKSCAAKFNNLHKHTGGKRSKLEEWLEPKLNQKYPQLIIKYNDVEAINSELDIYIPRLKLAFELNGILHYEPLFGEEKLHNIQSNDQRKLQTCFEKNIYFHTIDISSIRDHFKPKKGEFVFNAVCSIIDHKIATTFK